jgi:hypothetical protein
MDRKTPTWNNSLPSDHEFNSSYLEYIDAIDLDSNTITNLQNARKTLDVIRKFHFGDDFEIVEFTLGKDQPEIETAIFIGFDVGYGFANSLLFPSLEMFGKAYDEKIHRKEYLIILPFLTLMKAYFQPKVNQHYLFQDYETAKLYLDNIISIQKIYPQLWENEHILFDVIGVWTAPL